MAFDPIYNRPVGRKSPTGGNIDEFYIEESMRGEYTGTNLIYVGFARPGADEDDLVWQISQINYDGNSNPISILWPANASNVVSNDYEFSWTDRHTYSYS